MDNNDAIFEVHRDRLLAPLNSLAITGVPDINKLDTDSIAVRNEFSQLKKVIIGLGSPYQRNKEQAAIAMAEFPFLPETDRKNEVLSMTYPNEEILLPEYMGFVHTLEKHGVEVLRADPGAAYSFDYTCPRDIGFVIADVFYISSMAVQSRAQEYKTILKYIEAIDPEKVVRVPEDTKLEGGDVIVLDERTILVGINQRTNQKGYEFLSNHLGTHDYEVVPVLHNGLHLDCCLNPLGRGHLLIHAESLEGNSDVTWKLLKHNEWVRINAIEREHLATNILSINRDTIIARNHPSCVRVNGVIKDFGYSVEEIKFDGVPATGGSFRCASLVLSREGETQ